MEALNDTELNFLKDGNYVVRHNLLTEKNYTPYCGSNNVRCDMPRTKFDGEQFVCPKCGFRSEFPKEFIDYYKQKWNK